MCVESETAANKYGSDTGEQYHLFMVKILLFYEPENTLDVLVFKNYIQENTINLRIPGH